MVREAASRGGRRPALAEAPWLRIGLVVTALAFLVLFLFLLLTQLKLQLQ